MDAREFFAISYCRTTADDASKDTEVMNIHGLDVDVHRNLVDALRQVRRYLISTGLKPLVWVDQLCINQADAVE